MRKIYAILALIAFLGCLHAAGPGNVSSNLQMWLKADALTLNNGDPVSVWTDMSGNNNHASQDTLDFQPKYKTNVINASPVVEFANNDYLPFNGSIIANTNYTIIAVVRRNSANATSGVSGLSYSSHHYFLGGIEKLQNKNLHIGWRSNTTFTHAEYSNDYDMRVNGFSSGEPAYLYTIRHSNTKGKETYINGGLRGLNMNTATNGRLAHAGSWVGASIGRYIDMYIDPADGLLKGINTRFNGWVAELIVYNRDLSESERKAVEDYLKNKYNLPVSVDANSPAHYTDMFSPILSVRSDKTTDSKTSGGLTISGEFLTNSSSIYAGHNDANGLANTFNPNSLVYSDFMRLNRQWFLDFRGTLNTTFTFDLDQLGLSHFSPSALKYALLYRRCTCQNYEIVDSIATVVNNQISFSVPSRTTVTHNGFYTLGTLYYDELTLPIVLTSFNALALGNVSRISWTTASESNMMGYYLYRNTSPDFQSATLISKLIPAENSSSTRNYEYTDNELLHSSTYYYWLSSVDYNSNSLLHGPVMVKFESSESIPVIPITTGLDAIYPNPFNPQVNIRYILKNAADASITVYNMKGQMVFTDSQRQLSKGYHNLSWDPTGLPSGVYLLVFQSGDTKQSRRITLSK